MGKEIQTVGELVNEFISRMTEENLTYTEALQALDLCKVNIQMRYIPGAGRCGKLADVISEQFRNY